MVKTTGFVKWSASGTQGKTHGKCNEHTVNVRGRRREALCKTAYKRTHGIMDRGGKLNPQRMYGEQRQTKRELMAK